MTPPNTQFELKKNEYVAFDALSLRQLIVDRLNEQKIFTDQNFLGSNLASVIDIIAYAYHTLIFYLNRTSSESMFSEAQLFENMNRIVKLVDYDPVGFQTSTLSFVCSAQRLPQGVYTIPRYSFVVINNIQYSFNEDVVFVKTQDTVIEDLNELAQQKLLYQGLYQEMPTYTATGENNEIVFLNAGNELVDHFNIDVYVKSFLTGQWSQYTKTPNLFLENSSAEKYEIRLNENMRYEIKFGNDINGKKLNEGDKVAVYYLGSKGEDGQIGPNALGGSKLAKYNTVLYNELIENLLKDNYRLLTNEQLNNSILLNNPNSSTQPKPAETADDMRRLAAANYRSQNRLVTTRDYETFLQTNFINILADTKVINNTEYINGYLKYYHDIGLPNPALVERPLLNQILYSDSCNFNNVYVLCVPRATSQTFNYVLPSQKSLIENAIQNIKMVTADTVFLDPVYKSISFGVSRYINPQDRSQLPTPVFTSTATFDFDPENDQNLCILEISKRASSRRDNQSIINDVANIFRNYFDRETAKLGQVLDIRALTQQILSVEGVETFYTTRIDDPTAKVEGLSFFVWNPVYPNNDKATVTNNLPLRFFEYPYFNNISTISSRIKVTTLASPSFNQ